MAMLQTAQSLIRRVGRKAGIDEDKIESLLEPDQVHEFEIKLKNGQSFKAYRIQHNNKLGPYKGGIRYHPEVDREEVQALATLMSMKTAVAGLPFGGGKGGVALDPRKLTLGDLEELSREYVRKIYRHIGPDKDIPAPDVSTTAETIDWMVDEYQKLTGDETKASFTGKSLPNGGSRGRDAATGRGGVITLEKVLGFEGNPDKPITYAVQGFGNVGSFFGLVAQQDNPHWKMIAATDSSGGVLDRNGLDPSHVDGFKRGGQKLVNYSQGKSITNEELIAADVDVLVLAALGDAITEDNINKVKAKYILELANGPVNDKAYNHLSKHGVIIVPDVLANAGGVTVSYLEWLQNRSREAWPQKKVNQELRRYLSSAMDTSLKHVKEDSLTLKEAAILVALRRILRES